MMVFFEKGWGKFSFGKNFLNRESPTLIRANGSCPDMGMKNSCHFQFYS